MIPADTSRLPQEVVEGQEKLAEALQRQALDADKLEKAVATIQLKTGQVAALYPFPSF